MTQGETEIRQRYVDLGDFSIICISACCPCVVVYLVVVRGVGLAKVVAGTKRTNNSEIFFHQARTIQISVRDQGSFFVHVLLGHRSDNSTSSLEIGRGVAYRKTQRHQLRLSAAKRRATSNNAPAVVTKRSEETCSARPSACAAAVRHVGRSYEQSVAIVFALLLLHNAQNGYGSKSPFDKIQGIRVSSTNENSRACGPPTDACYN